MTTYTMSHSEFNAMHLSRCQLHADDHRAAVKLSKEDRKVERMMIKMASVMVRDWLNTELWLHVDLNKA